MTTRILYHRWCISVNRERNILKISQSAKWQTRESRITKAVCLIALLGYVCGVVVKVACCGFIAYRFWTALRGASAADLV
jgi:uncharacterized membrane protein